MLTLYSPSSHLWQCSGGHTSWLDEVPEHQSAYGTQRKPCGQDNLEAERENREESTKTQNTKVKVASAAGVKASSLSAANRETKVWLSMGQSYISVL